MAQIICFEAYPSGRKKEYTAERLVSAFGFEERQNRYGSYYYKEVSSLDSWMTKRLLNNFGCRFKSYDKRYSRSSSYRSTFFSHNKGPYHCAYCGKRLKGADLEVDHLVPISKAKESFGVRTWLHICGVTNVNDHKNLVAACKRCNRRKSDKMGLWTARGVLGRYRAFWVVRDITLFCCIALALGLILSITPLPQMITNLLG